MATRARASTSTRDLPRHRMASSAVPAASASAVQPAPAGLHCSPTISHRPHSAGASWASEGASLTIAVPLFLQYTRCRVCWPSPRRMPRSARTVVPALGAHPRWPTGWTARRGRRRRPARPGADVVRAVEGDRAPGRAEGDRLGGAGHRRPVEHGQRQLALDPGRQQAQVAGLRIAALRIGARVVPSSRSRRPPALTLPMGTCRCCAAGRARCCDSRGRACPRRCRPPRARGRACCRC